DKATYISKEPVHIFYDDDFESICEVLPEDPTFLPKEIHYIMFYLTEMNICISAFHSNLRNQLGYTFKKG
ncbi:hypothetical protein DFH28DRAFT_917923, partial [Melampsora americana]